MIQNKSASLLLEAQRFIDWCSGDVLPLWAKQGVDRKRGGFFEQLHFDGTPDEQVLRRVRVTSRQIYAFSHASLLGWSDFRELVSWGVDYLVSKVLRVDNEPGFAHLLDADGAICDRRRDLYDHAFHILALSWAYRATGDAQMLTLAKDTLAFVDESMGAPNGGWQEGVPATNPRRQNPHMHMYEALLALYEASGDESFLSRAGDIGALLAERFIDSETGLLFEFFGPDLEPEKPASIEPGHMAEWCWLLHCHARLHEADVIELAQKMGCAADGFGQKGKGFLLDAYTVTGDVLSKSRRLWGQTEWLKSMVVRYGNGNEQMGKQMANLLERIRTNYLTTEVPGLWIDQFDSDGCVLSENVPASIVYHLVSAAAEVTRTVKSIEDQGA